MASRVRCFSALTAALAVAVVLVPAGGARSLDTTLPTLTVTYTINCTFTITDDSGNPVTTIAPGSYQVQIITPEVFAEVDLTGITDMTACKSFVQFQLTGPGVSLSTTLQDGDEDYGLLDATFQPSSTYVAQDNNQPSVARVVFTTQASGSPAVPVGPATPPPSSSSSTSSSSGSGNSVIGTSITATASRGTLSAAVSSSGKPTLTYKGKGVTSLPAGRYTVSAVDRSKTGGFIIQESGKAATTVAGISFVGRRTVTIDLGAGQWFFYPTFVGKKNYFIVTT